VNNETWSGVDAYFTGAIAPDAKELEFILTSSVDAGLPAIAVSPAQGKLLAVLARSIGAKRILEIGTLGGYSAAWMARALPPDGRLVTLELDRKHADAARRHLAHLRLDGRVDVVVGPAIESLAELAAEKPGPFDLVFIDADKPSNADYFHGAVPMTRRGGLIIVDNVVRDGAVVDPTSKDPGVLGVRRLVDAVAREKRVSATVVQTVGSKGYDGFLVATVN
jgi:predicted O-methyltransferase YrrM